MAASFKSKLIIIASLAVVLLAILASLYYKGGPIYTGLKNLNLIPTSEQFTELYFQNASSLPAYIGKGQTLSFSFVIHNVEGATTTYSYIAYFQSTDGAKTVLENSELSLPNNASTTINITHAFAAAAGAGTVIVDLPALNQQIDFLLTNHS